MAYKIDSEEISGYITAILKGINEGVSHGYYLSSSVKIRLGVRNVVEKGGGLKLEVVSIEGKKSKEEHAVVEFEVVNPFGKETKERMEILWKKGFDKLFEILNVPKPKEDSSDENKQSKNGGHSD